MKRIALLYGSIAGIICGGMFFVLNPIGSDGAVSLNNGQLYGFAIMIVAFGLIFLGLKHYRDRLLGGRITFIQALKFSLLFSLITSSFYVIGWEIYTAKMDPDFATQYVDHMRSELRIQGMDEAAIELTSRIHAVLEPVIRAHPEQYLWVHNRYKTRPPEE